VKILHVIPQFPLFGDNTVVGGHANALYVLAKTQAAAGHDVTILSHAPNHNGAFKIANQINVVSLDSRLTPGTYRHAVGFILMATVWLFRRASQYDLVHGHSGFIDYVLLTALVALLHRRPTVHSLYCPIEKRRGRLANPLYSALLRWCIARVGAMSSISANVHGSLCQFTHRSECGVVVRCPIDCVRFHPGDEREFRSALGIADDEIAILFVGNTTPQKNLKGTLDAFAHLAQSTCRSRLIVTTELRHSSPDEQKVQLMQQAEDLGIFADIIQLGIVHDMPVLMRACDILVAPFLDSLGPSDYFLAALEAMSSAKPVVVSAVGGMPEVVDSSVGRLIDPIDPDDFACALQQFVADEHLRRSLGDSGRRRIVQYFDPNLIVNQIDAVYRRIAS